MSVELVPSLENMDQRVWSQYLGVLALLGNIAPLVSRGDAAQYGIDKAFRDANNVLLVRRTGIRYQRDSRGGYSAFSHKELMR